MADRKAYEQQYRQVWESQGWQDFRHYRTQWDELIRRHSPQVLNPSAAQFLQSTNSIVDVQSPDLEKDLHDRVSVLLSNSARIDAISLDTLKTAKSDVEDIRIWSAGRWLQQDETRMISRAIFEQQCRYGVATARKTWRMTQEPDDADSRDEYYADHLAETFGNQYVSPLELAWFPLTNPTVFIQESIIPYIDARDLKNTASQPFRLSRDNKAYFLGDTQPTEEVEESTWQTKKVRVTIVATKDKESGRWHICEWVRGDSSQLQDSAELDEYDCPFDHAPYFITPSGDELLTETSAHLRYRPMIYPLIVDIQELNALVTLLVMTAVWHLQNPFYVRLDRVRPELLPHLEGLADAGMGVIEGSGAERKFLFRTPEAGTGEVMAAPALEQMPNAALPDAILLRLQQVQANIEFHRSNRYLTGEAFDQTREQPATTTLNQVEAAATPFGSYLTNAANTIKEWLLAEHEAIIYWDESSAKGTEKPYPLRVRGDEPVAQPREPGEEVTINAAKLHRPYVLQVTIRNETQAEHAMNQQMADIAYEKGAITKEQWLKERGAVDPQKQMEDLWKGQMEMATDMEFQQVFMQSYRSLFSALTGLNAALVQPMGMGAEGAPSAPVPTGTANGGTPLLARPQMSPAPTAGASGSTAGMGAAANGGVPV